MLTLTGQQLLVGVDPFTVYTTCMSEYDAHVKKKDQICQIAQVQCNQMP